MWKVLRLFLSFWKIDHPDELNPLKSPSTASLAIYDIEISPDALTSLFVWYSWRVLLTILSWNHISLFWIMHICTCVHSWPIWQVIMKSIHLGFAKSRLNFHGTHLDFFPFYFSSLTRIIKEFSIIFQSSFFLSQRFSLNYKLAFFSEVILWARSRYIVRCNDHTSTLYQCNQAQLT